MPDHNRDAEPSNGVINAYSNVSSSSSNRIFIIIIAIFSIFLLRNAITRNYNEETKSYLTSKGRTDIVDTIIPKTSTEIRMERLNKDELLKELALNMTIIMSEMNEMKIEINKLKNNST